MKKVLWIVGSWTRRIVAPMSYARHICSSLSLVVMIAATPLSLFGQRVVGTISKPGLQPWGVAVYEAGNKVFIADHATSHLLIYDENTFVLLGEVSIDGAGGSFMVVDETRGKLYAGGAQKIAVVNITTGVLIDYLSGTYENLFGLVHDESLGKLYTLSIEGLRQIDIATDSITVIPGFGGGGYEFIAVNPVTHEVFVTRVIEDVLVIVDGISLSQTIVPGLGGMGVAANWKENKVYISYCGVNSLGKPLLSVYDRNTNTSSDIPAPNDATGVFYDSSSNRVYTNSEVNAVSTIIEGASDSSFNLPIPSATTALGFRHATNHVYYAGREFIGVLDESSQLLELIPISNPTPAALIRQSVAVNQSTGRIYVINDANALNFVTVLQDSGAMTRPPVFLGSIGFPATLHVIDPVTKVVMDTWSLFSGFQDVHQIAVRPGGGRLYVPHVSPFDEELRIFAGAGQSSLIAHFSTGGNDSRSVVVSPDGDRIYVTNSATNNVSVIDAVTNAILTYIPVGEMPWGAAATPDGKFVYVANQSDNTVAVIATASNTVTKTIAVGTKPYGLAINPAGTKAYVTNSGVGTVSVIEIDSQSVVATVSVGSTPHWLAFAPDGKHAYVGNRGSGSVSVINTGTDQTIHTINGVADPEGIGAMPDGSEVLVVNSNPTGASALSVINPSDNSVNAIALPADARETVSLTIADPTSRFAGRITCAGGLLNGALVRALQAGEVKATATTNASGDYCIFNLPSGTYDIEVSADGHRTQSLQNQSVSGGQTRVLHLMMTTHVDGSVETPKEFSLCQNFPNPFNPSTTISFTIAGSKEYGVGSTETKLAVYDLLGREVAVLVNEKKQPGTYGVKFDASAFSSGVYIYRLQAGDFVASKKLVLVK
jgi:YVTN family beta-propeller protein